MAAAQQTAAVALFFRTGRHFQMKRGAENSAEGFSCWTTRFLIYFRLDLAKVKATEWRCPVHVAPRTNRKPKGGQSSSNKSSWSA